ncbi:MAG: YidC/Oxa1 family membrane protein insertase [Ruminiclostridium sp.]|jgi:YidC/Oxa1 family membrane protein insertase|nr:YidC/Oxa1 family membrane protein insertase [Ruminiclostridium sp.]
MTMILTPFAKLILWFYEITGSYAIALVLFGLVVRMILFPVFLKGRKSMLAMSGLAEKQKVLQQKYMRDRQRYSIELQKLYEEEGVKPSGGCLWSFLPMPFLMLLYLVIRRPLTYLMGMSEDMFNSVSNLLYGEVLDYKNQQLQMAQDVFLNHDRITSAVPELSDMPMIDFSFLGANLSSTPHFMFWKQEDLLPAFVLFMIPVVSAVLNIVTTRVSTSVNAKITGASRTMDQNTKMTMFMMPLFSLWICFTLPAALGIYWIANSIFAILQEYMNIPFLRKHQKKLEEDKVKRREEEKERVKQEKKAQAEAKKKAAEEMRRIQMERKVNKSLAAASRVGMRTYARGRSYDPDRYPSYPYREIAEIVQEQEAQRERMMAEKAAGKGKKDAAMPPPPAAPADPAPVDTAPAEEEAIPAPLTTQELEAQTLENIQAEQEEE